MILSFVNYLLCMRIHLFALDAYQIHVLLCESTHYGYIIYTLDE